MINNYNEHAANERNFLSWIRTGVSLLAFGILLEKSASWFKGDTHNSFWIIDDVIGITFIGLGTVLLITSTLRLKKLSKLIDSHEIFHWDEKNHSFIFGIIISIIAALIFLVFFLYKTTTISS